MENQKMKIEIWSDVICPFCYAGKRKFESALVQFAHKEELSIEWKSFEIDIKIAERISPGMNIYQYLAQKRGVSYEESIAMHQITVDLAKSVGLEYNFERVVLTSSFDAHRVIQYAKTKNLATEIIERICHAYFTEGKNIGNTGTLIELGKEVGLTEMEVREALNNDMYAENVRKDMEEAKEKNVRKVPSYILNGKQHLIGIQSPEELLKTLEMAYAEWIQKSQGASNNNLEGLVCSIEGGDCN
ncbi:MAG TPA: DsbA family oxidoreductase [Puia sp.]|nr:DsbA family oxidoreductase [Puia sp.]